MENRKENSRELNINLQSSLKFSLDFLKYRNIEDASLMEVFRLSEVVAEFCLLQKNEDFKVTCKKLETWMAEKKNTKPIKIKD